MDILDRKDVKVLYGKKYESMVKQARVLLSKDPPDKVIALWQTVGDPKFREKMLKSDIDTLVTFQLVMTLMKGEVKNLYFCDWELLYENMKLMSLI